MQKSWQLMSEEIMSGIAEWRQQHPQVTFSEIEKVDQRLWVMVAKMLAVAALSSGQSEWEPGSLGCTVAQIAG